MMIAGKWRLDGLVGVGGMAAVYCATHRNGAVAAIKILHPEFAGHQELRSRFMREQIARDNVRGAIRHLKSNGVLLYLPDQTYLGNQSALVPFFGEPALTNIVTSKLARLSGAAGLTYFFRRRPRG